MVKIINESNGSKYSIRNLTPAGKAISSVAAIVIIILLFMILSIVRVVSVGHVGIVTRLGRVVGEDQSGLHFILPWPIEQMTGMNVQIQLSQVPANAATLDLQQVSTTVALNYNLTSQTANQVYREVGTNYVSTIIDPIVQETFKAVTAQFNATDLVQERSKVQAETLNELTKAFNAKGITVDNLNIVNFQFSSQYSSAIENKQVEAQNVQTAQYKLQQAQLNAQANQVQDAALSPQILEQQAISKWDGKMPQVVSGGTGNIFGINLTD
jgi:regulator of protease activity HflC (stomatin/prohibitin superfamily)